MTFHECCHAIVAAAADAKQLPKVMYAYGYARQGLGMTDQFKVKAQAIFILANLSTWRGRGSDDVKASLRYLIENTGKRLRRG